MMVTATTGAASFVPQINPADSNSDMPTSMNFHASYRGEVERAQDADVILQLKVNLARLQDLHGRMRFLMGEIGYLLKADTTQF